MALCAHGGALPKQFQALTKGLPGIGVLFAFCPLPWYHNKMNDFFFDCLRYGWFVLASLLICGFLVNVRLLLILLQCLRLFTHHYFLFAVYRE